MGNSDNKKDNSSKAASYKKYTDFMRKHYTQEDPTHVLMKSRFGLVGKFNISDKHIDEFHNLYNDVIFFKDVHVLECQKDVGPLLVDIDFRFDQDKRYPKSVVTDISEIIFDVVDRFYDAPYDKLELFVFEKETNVQDSKGEETVYKDGIHFMMPHLALHKNMRYNIIKEVCNSIENNCVFEDLELTNKEDVVDLSVAYRNPWFMYGSRKPEKKPYRLTKIFNKDLMLVNSEYSDKQLTKILSIRKFDENDMMQVRDEYQDYALQNIEDKKPQKEKQKKDRHNGGVVKNTAYIKICQDDVKFAKELVTVLSDKRATVYNDWVRVGWCLFNTGGYELLDAYKDFSKRIPSKYKEGCCEEVFAHAKVGGYSIATLKWWARQDNPDKYAEVTDKYISEYLKNAASLTDHDIARYIYEKYKHIVKKTELDWYIFENGRWRVNRKGHILGNMISTEVPRDIISLQIYYKNIAKDKTGEEQDIYNKRCENLEKLIRKIKSRNSKNSIMAEAGDLLTEENFMNTLDTQLHLVGFDNGVYDLEQGVFREAVPDDRITKSVGYDYIEIDEDHEDWKALNKYFGQVFVEKDLRTYSLKFFSSLLDGFMRDQKYHMLTGTGANGKSTTIALLRDTLGDYYIPVPVTLFTRKQGSAANASPELMVLKGIRAGCMQEPDTGDKMNTGRMKEITGGDQIIGRALFKEMEKFKPQCKIFMTCNNLPDVNSLDNGTWRRIRVMPFDSEFVDKKDVKHPHQFPKDKELEHSIGRWKQAFMCMLLHYYKLYRKEGLIEPEVVIKHTKDYKRSNDVYQEYIDTHMIITNSKKNREEIDILYEYFKTWYTSSVPSGRCPKKSDFSGYLGKKHFDIRGKYIYGVIYKVEEEGDGELELDENDEATE